MKRFGFKPMAFARGLKNMLACIGISEPPRDMKEEVMPEWGFSYRHAAQTLGTEWGRRLLRDDIWVLVLREFIRDSKDDIAITDVRFENEADMIRREGGIIVHMTGRKAELGTAAGHASEVGIARLVWDETLDNSGDTLALEKNINELIQRIYHA